MSLKAYGISQILYSCLQKLEFCPLFVAVEVVFTDSGTSEIKIDISYIKAKVLNLCFRKRKIDYIIAFQIGIDLLQKSFKSFRVK